MAGVGYGNELLTDDPLDSLRNLVISRIPFGYQNFRWWCVGFFLYGLIFESVTIHKSFLCGNEYWLCLVGVLIYIPGITDLFCSSVIDFKMDVIRKSLFRNCNSLTLISNEVSAKISKEIKIMKTYCFIELIASVVLHGVSFPMTDEERKFLCSEMILKEYFGKFHNIVFFTSIIFIIANGVAIANIVAHILYMSSHVKYQYYLIQEYVEDMRNFVNDERDDMHYQLSVSRRIAHFVKQHQKINRLWQEFIDPLGSLLALCMPPVAESSIVSLLFLLATNVSAVVLSKGVIALIYALSIFLLVFYCGQVLIDESNKLHNLLCEVPWTDWDVKNRKTLLIILPITAKPRKVCFYGLCEVSFVSILATAKLGYTLLALAMNLTYL